MGCLRFILSLVILIFAYIGFMSVGGDKFVTGLFDGFLNPPVKESIEKAKTIADFSAVPKDDYIDKAYEIAGAKAILIKNQGNNQTMIIANPAWIEGLKKENFELGTIDSRLRAFTGKFNYSPIKIEHVEILDKSSFKAMGQDIPYVKVRFNFPTNKDKKMEGIIGAVENKQLETRLVLSFNEEGKYNQKTAENFFKGLKLY